MDGRTDGRNEGISEKSEEVERGQMSSFNSGNSVNWSNVIAKAKGRKKDRIQSSLDSLSSEYYGNKIVFFSSRKQNHGEERSLICHWSISRSLTPLLFGNHRLGMWKQSIFKPLPLLPLLPPLPLLFCCSSISSYPTHPNGSGQSLPHSTAPTLGLGIQWIQRRMARDCLDAN